MKVWKEIINLIGIGSGLISLIWIFRMFIIISFGYYYIAYEPNIFILYSEIISLFICILILFRFLVIRMMDDLKEDN